MSDQLQLLKDSDSSSLDQSQLSKSEDMLTRYSSLRNEIFTHLDLITKEVGSDGKVKDSINFEEMPPSKPWSFTVQSKRLYLEVGDNIEYRYGPVLEVQIHKEKPMWIKVSMTKRPLLVIVQ